MTPTTPSNMTISELDFTGIKTSIVTYMQGQDVFSGYDFEGSNLNILMDILSYNTHYNSFYVNVVANEAFLDSATTRNSILSHAKMIGYIPHSKRAAVALIDFNVRAFDSNTVRTILQSGSPFSSNIDGASRIFYTTEDYISNDSSIIDGELNFIFKNIEVYEGILQSDTFIVDSNTKSQKFRLSSPDIDINTIKVVVNKSSSEISQVVFKLADNIITVGPDDNVYWVQETNDNQYELFFGDDVIGKALSDNNLIIVSYISTNGETANFAKNFTFSGTVENSFDNTITIVNTPSSFGGSERESDESIRRLAPLQYQSQNRAVTANDYESILLKEHPSIDSVYVWGGEDNNPPIYGKVFISIKPKAGEFISDIEKNVIKNQILEQRGIITIIPEIVEPDYVYLIVTCNVYYEPSLTNSSESVIREGVRSNIITFGETAIEKFQKVYRESKLLSKIDSSNPSITGSSVEIDMKKSLVLNVNTRSNYDILFNNPIYVSKTSKLPAVWSETFDYIDPIYGSVRGYMKDDGDGIINIYTTAGGKETLVLDSFFTGTVNYAKGEISLRKFKKNNASDTLVMWAKPAKEDINTKANQILLIEPTSITVNLFAEKI